jgi:hypothetical protein
MQFALPLPGAPFVFRFVFPFVITSNTEPNPNVSTNREPGSGRANSQALG